MKADDAKRLKELASRHRRRQALDIDMLKALSRGNF
jgi:hypothetical protein